MNFNCIFINDVVLFYDNFRKENYLTSSIRFPSLALDIILLFSSWEKLMKIISKLISIYLFYNINKWILYKIKNWKFIINSFLNFDIPMNLNI